MYASSRLRSEDPTGARTQQRAVQSSRLGPLPGTVVACNDKMSDTQVEVEVAGAEVEPQVDASAETAEETDPGSDGQQG